jgi:hypothetical protein
MMLQLHSQSAQQALMQRELQNMKYKLEQTSKTLAQKDLLIGSLESDLEHMIDQLVKIKYSDRKPNENCKWMSRAVPGINQDLSEQVVV